MGIKNLAQGVKLLNNTEKTISLIKIRWHITRILGNDSIHIYQEDSIRKFIFKRSAINYAWNIHTSQAKRIQGNVLFVRFADGSYWENNKQDTTLNSIN